MHKDVCRQHWKSNLSDWSPSIVDSTWLSVLPSILCLNPARICCSSPDTAQYIAQHSTASPRIDLQCNAVTEIPTTLAVTSDGGRKKKEKDEKSQNYHNMTLDHSVGLIYTRSEP